jgi:hypothetical protein
MTENYFHIFVIIMTKKNTKITNKQSKPKIAHKQGKDNTPCIPLTTLVPLWRIIYTIFTYIVYQHTCSYNIGNKNLSVVWLYHSSCSLSEILTKYVLTKTFCTCFVYWYGRRKCNTCYCLLKGIQKYMVHNHCISICIILINISHR